MTNKRLRVSEVYLSIQGEGPRTGEQTIFVRFAGCNLRCPGWPCDTPHAIKPELYRNEWKWMTVDELANLIHSVDQGRHLNICYTGGEPFLQQSALLDELTMTLFDEGHPTFEVFTNGTIEHPDWAHAWIYFIMDWKLTGSGEDPYDAVRLMNLERLQPGDAVKFVCKDRADYDQAVSLWQEHIENAAREGLIVYAGVVWGELEVKELVDWIFEDKLPWHVNIQMHNYIWPANERAR